MDLLAWADVRFVVLEAQPLVRRVTSRGAEVADPYQGLQVIGKTIELVREGSIVGTALQRVAYLQLAIVLTSHGVRAEEWIVHPLAEFVGHGGDVLRECLNVHVGCVGIGLAVRRGAVCAVIAADAAVVQPYSLCQVNVIPDEEGDDVRRSPQLGHEALHQVIVVVDVGKACSNIRVITKMEGVDLATGVSAVDGLLWLKHGLQRTWYWGASSRFLPTRCPAGTRQCTRYYPGRSRLA